MEPQELRGLSPVDQLAVLLLRHSFDAEHLRSMRKTDPVEYAVSARVFDTQTIANVEMYEILVEGDEAEGYLRDAWGLQPDAAVYLKKQGGAWRIDLARYLAQFLPVGVIVNAGAVDEATDIEAVVMADTILWITGRLPDRSIWNPPG